MCEVTVARSFLSTVPAMLPDQTLYSWATMFHSLSGNITEDETRFQLFGSAKSGRHFHIPSHLDTFCANTHLVFGPPEHVIATRTIVPYFSRFRATSVARDTLARLRGGSAAGTSQMLGMWKKRTHDTLQGRGCLSCIREDQSEFGFAYWHRAHLLPGVLFCQIHKTPLVVSPISIGHRFHSQFIVPYKLLAESQAYESCCYTQAQWTTLIRLAILAQQMVEVELVGGYDQNRFLRSCRGVLSERVQLDPMGKFDPLKIAADYNYHFRDVFQVPELSVAIAGRGPQALLWLIEEESHICHPLEWMLIVDWLFGDWNTFSTIYAAET